MKEIKAGIVLENAARLAGRAVSQLSIPENWRVLAAMSLNAGMTRIAAEKFPMLTRTESRRYRPNWSSTEGYSVGNEVWHNGSYWKLTESASGEPGVASCWQILDMKDVVAFIAWDQPWENTVIHRAGVDANRFAYAADPKYYPNATPYKVAEVTDFGILLEAPAPEEVWVRFTPESTPISFIEWSESTAYESGDVAYSTTTKDAYLCLADVTSATAPASDTEHWVEVRIPGEFEAFLTRLVAADLMTLDQGKQQARSQAEEEFNRLCEFYHAGNGETRIRRGRFV